MKTISPAILTIALFFSTTTHAVDKPHSFGLEIHNGTIDAVQTGPTSQLNDVDTLHFMLRYDYNLTPKFSLGLGYLNGDSSDYPSFFNLFTNSRLDYDAILLNARYQFILSKRNRFYVQASAVKYDYDIIDDNTVLTSNDDTDYGLAIGWAFKFDKGLGLGVGYNHLRLGSEIKLRTVNFGINYNF